ncbi:hypothetical protein HanRHA438_Chr10g0476531 [Helianthus annuus]|nr:hypothetical protein HanRHA438_Chr10g0476531 [Helianthus annuus]
MDRINDVIKNASDFSCKKSTINMQRPPTIQLSSSRPPIYRNYSSGHLQYPVTFIIHIFWPNVLILGFIKDMSIFVNIQFSNYI